MSNAITPDQIPDRRDQVPLGGPHIDQRLKDEGLDDAVDRVVEEQGGLLTPTNAGVSGDRDGKNREKGIVFANSHNDEMQKEPFTLALKLGLASMEADTWLAKPSWFDHHSPKSQPTLECPVFNDTSTREEEEPVLYVGHLPTDLKRENTLKRVYLDRIWDILEEVNSGADRASMGDKGKEIMDEGRGNKRGIIGKKGWDWNGVFTDKGAKDQTLLFYIDVKPEQRHNPSGPSGGEIMFPYILKALEPFRKRGYLTTFTRKSDTSPLTEGTMSIGPLTIIGTGGTPILRVLEQNPRDVFFDAPLLALDKPIIYTDPKTGDLQQLDWNPTFAPVASGKFPLQAYLAEAVSTVTPVSLTMLDNIPYPKSSINPTTVMSSVAAHIKLAHSKNIEARWWGVISWPKRVRWRMWRRLKALGADWINADELEEVASFLRGGQEPRDEPGEEQDGVKEYV